MVEPVPTLRIATAADTERILAVDACPDRAAMITRAIADGACTIAEDDAGVAGFLIRDESFFGQPFIAMLVVRADARRRGIGMALMRSAEEDCAGSKLFTSTNESNVAMQQLSERLGFVRSGRIDNLDEGDPEIVYFKALPE